MKNKLKPFFITIIVIIAVYFAGKYALDAFLGDMCGNDIKQKIPSPNGQNIAYVFERSCGATTGFSLQLSILYKDEKFENESGNTIRTDKEFSIEWANNKSLKVIYDKSSETYKMDKKVNGIKIQYIGKKEMKKGALFSLDYYFSSPELHFSFIFYLSIPKRNIKKNLKSGDGFGRINGSGFGIGTLHCLQK
jgi:hypothetical protein